MASCGKRAGGLLRSSADDWARWFAHASCLWSSHWVQRCRRHCCLSSLASHLISSRLVSSCRANSISLLSFPRSLFLAGHFKECKTGSVERQHCEFALKRTLRTTYISVPPPHHHIFRFPLFDNREPSRFADYYHLTQHWETRILKV